MHIPPHSRLIVSTTLGELEQSIRPVPGLLAHQDHTLLTAADAGNGERVGLGPAPPTHRRREGTNTNMLARTPARIDLWDFNARDAQFREGPDDGIVESCFQNAEKIVESIDT